MKANEAVSNIHLSFKLSFDDMQSVTLNRSSCLSQLQRQLMPI